MSTKIDDPSGRRPARNTPAQWVCLILALAGLLMVIFQPVWAVYPAPGQYAWKGGIAFAQVTPIRCGFGPRTCLINALYGTGSTCIACWRHR